MEPNTKPSEDAQSAPEPDASMDLSAYVDELLRRSLAAVDRNDYPAAEKLLSLAQRAQFACLDETFRTIERIDAMIERELGFAALVTKGTPKK